MAVLLRGRGARAVTRLIRTADQRCLLAGSRCRSGDSKANCWNYGDSDNRICRHHHNCDFTLLGAAASGGLTGERRVGVVQRNDKWLVRRGYPPLFSTATGEGAGVRPRRSRASEACPSSPTPPGGDELWRTKGKGNLTGSSDFSNFRGFSSSSSGGDGNSKEGERSIAVTFVNKDGSEKKIRVPLGQSMLEAAHENDIELEGACEGSLACSTCHVVVTEEYYRRLPEPTDEENDMLDLAFGLTDTSRLGCQVKAKEDIDGIRLAIPAATRNFAVDGHVPKPH